MFGELSLGGELRDSPGALAVAEGARRAGLRRLIVPARARPGGGAGGGTATWPGCQACGPRPRCSRVGPPPLPPAAPRTVPRAGARAGPRRRPRPCRAAAGPRDRRRGRPQPAAGGRRPARARRCSPGACPRSCPAMTRDEAIEVTRIHSVAGLHADGAGRAPGRSAPRTTRSRRPGWSAAAPRRARARRRWRITASCSSTSCPSSSARASMRSASRSRTAASRSSAGQRALVFPTRFMLVAATNPCPCGFAGVGDRCRCGEADLRRHRRRLSGPLLDRMDLLVDVERPSEHELRSAAARPPQRGPASASPRRASASASGWPARRRAATARWTHGWSAATSASRRRPNGCWPRPTRSAP